MEQNTSKKKRWIEFEEKYLFFILLFFRPSVKSFLCLETQKVRSLEVFCFKQTENQGWDAISTQNKAMPSFPHF